VSSLAAVALRSGGFLWGGFRVFSQTTLEKSLLSNFGLWTGFFGGYFSES
jgi:hypothetical protein